MEKKHFIGKLHCFTDRRVDVYASRFRVYASDEGSILFMPVTLPDVSNSEVKEYCRTR
jgi:hypothetical protein